MTMITPSYLGETIEYSSLHACRSTLEDPTPSLAEMFGGGEYGLKMADLIIDVDNGLSVDEALARMEAKGSQGESKAVKAEEAPKAKGGTGVKEATGKVIAKEKAVVSVKEESRPVKVSQGDLRDEGKDVETKQTKNRSDTNSTNQHE